ncbi:MAG: NAD(P)H-dependent flavin oxidoreductase [Alphaproteobacteria bacterium]|jgi:enoyl-[acyl-carrier protein] reductase II
MFHTELCDLLEIEFPILQGAMQGAGKPKLVAAVSEAGGLGVLPTYGEREEDLVRQIEETQALTKKPFGVNITPLGAKFTERRAAICIDMKVPVVTTGLGDPGPRAVGDLRSAGIKVIPVVPTVRHALRLEAEGADAIVASGSEAGGHVGSVATLPLLPMVIDAVKVPVVAAGGIGDARGFLAAMAMGAAGVQLGTRLICTTESAGGRWYSDAILKISEEETIVSKSLTGKTVRAFATPEVKAFEAARLSGAAEDELKRLQRIVRKGRHQDDTYDGQHQAVVGQIAGMLNDPACVKPAGEVIREIMNEAMQLTERLSKIALK